MLRSLVLDQLGHYGDEGTIKEAQRRFSDHCSGKCPLPSDLKTTVFSICLANGDDTTFDQLIQVIPCLYYETKVLFVHVFLWIKENYLADWAFWCSNPPQGFHLIETLARKVSCDQVVYEENLLSFRVYRSNWEISTFTDCIMFCIYLHLTCSSMMQQSQMKRGWESTTVWDMDQLTNL